MTIDERLEKLTERTDAIAVSVELLTRDVHELRRTVAEHEEWRKKVERSLFASFRAALRTWDKPLDNPEST
jgi:prefoldin subunit 5